MEDHLIQHTVIADIALCTILIANILYIVSFVSTAWSVPHGKNNIQYGYGLWRYCDTDEATDRVVCGSLTDGTRPAWLGGAQAMMAMAFICLLLAMLTMIGYICVRALNQRKIVIIIFCSLCLPAAFFSFIGIIIYGVKMDSWLTREGFKYVHLSWGFILANIAMVAIIVSGVIGLVELKTNPRLDTNEPPIIGMDERGTDSRTSPERY